MSQETRRAYNQKILAQVDRYLETFPEEIERISKLRSQLLDNSENICDRANMRGHLTGSGLFYSGKIDSVLLVHHRALDLWIQPGGHLEKEEEPLECATREFLEETGISAAELSDWHTQSKIALDIDTHFIPANEKKKESSHFHHDFLYLLVETKKESESDDLNSIEDLKINRFELADYDWVKLDMLISGDYEEKLKRAARKIRRLMVRCN